MSRLLPTFHVFRVWHARKDLNPQPAVLETAALPIELRAYVLRVRFANLYAGYASIIIRDGYRGVKQFSARNDRQRTTDDKQVSSVDERSELASVLSYLLRFAV